MDTGHEAFVRGASFLGIADPPDQFVLVGRIVPSAEPSGRKGEAETNLAFQPRGFGAPALTTCAGFGKGAVHRHRQPRQILLQHAVDCALLTGIVGEFFSCRI